MSAVNKGPGLQTRQKHTEFLKTSRYAKLLKSFYRRLLEFVSKNKYFFHVLSRYLNWETTPVLFRASLQIKVMQIWLLKGARQKKLAFLSDADE